VPRELEDIWPEIQAELHKAVGPSAYDLWLAQLEPVSLDAAVLVISAPDSRRGWVADRFMRVLQTSMAAVLGPEIAIDVISASAAARHGEDPAAPGRRRGPSAPDPLNPKYTFDQFVIGDSNRLAHAAALAVAELPGQAYNPLFLHGPPGLGKTHLLHSIAAYVAAYGDGRVVRYATVESFTNDFVTAIQSSAMDRFKASYRGVDVLLIDDVQFLERKSKTEEELFHTFNELYEAGSQLVLASDRAPEDIGRVERRLRERFACGLVAPLQPPDFSMRLTFLRKRANLDALHLADPVALEVIADRVQGNLRALEAALIRLVAFHSLTGRPIDGALAVEVLDGLEGRRTPVHRSVRDIQDAVCTAFGVSHKELVSATKVARITWPRQIGMFLSRELTDQTLPTIGRHFGGRNHATVLHACKRTNQRIEHDAEARAAVDGLRRRLAGEGPGGGPSA
jgi:chromosomal replication initiator protein